MTTFVFGRRGDRFDSRFEIGYIDEGGSFKRIAEADTDWWGNEITLALNARENAKDDGQWIDVTARVRP